MRICPLCENEQETGEACDICGSQIAWDEPVAGVESLGDGLLATSYAHDEAGPGKAASLEGLESTSFEFVEATGEPLAELEPTEWGEVAVGGEMAFLDLEPTRAEPVEVNAAEIADLERTRAESTGVVRRAGSPLECWYCRAPAEPGQGLCARCGMRLPSLFPAPKDSSPKASICGCGESILLPLCPSCGARNG